MACPAVSRREIEERLDEMLRPSGEGALQRLRGSVENKKTATNHPG
jgi:hypothetical protein